MPKIKSEILNGVNVDFHVNEDGKFYWLTERHDIGNNYHHDSLKAAIDDANKKTKQASKQTSIAATMLDENDFRNVFELTVGTIVGIHQRLNQPLFRNQAGEAIRDTSNKKWIPKALEVDEATHLRNLWDQVQKAKKDYEDYKRDLGVLHWNEMNTFIEERMNSSGS